jgi:hypothetical protein
VQVLIALLAVVLIAVVALVISAPLRAARREVDRSPERGELEAAREAKYREIRDAELDYRTGKLSREDFEAVDGALRAEGLAILDRLQESERTERTERAEHARADAEHHTPDAQHDNPEREDPDSERRG